MLHRKPLIRKLLPIKFQHLSFKQMARWPLLRASMWPSDHLQIINLQNIKLSRSAHTGARCEHLFTLLDQGGTDPGPLPMDFAGSGVPPTTGVAVGVATHSSAEGHRSRFHGPREATLFPAEVERISPIVLTRLAGS